MTVPRDARSLLAAGRAIDAIEVLRDHLEEDPTDARAWNDVAEAMLTVGQSASAVPAARQAWVLTRTPDAACLMAVALAAAGRAPDALQLVEAAIRAGPSTARAWGRIARVLELVGAEDAAVDARWQAHLRSPRDPDAAAIMADRLERTGRRTEARRVVMQALEHAPDHPHALRIQVRLDIAEGQLAAASQRIRGLLLGGALPAETTAGLWKDLARVEAARDNPDDAFMAATVGNAQALLAWTLAHGAPPDRLQTEARAMLEAAVRTPAASSGVPEEAFLVGFPGPALDEVRGAFESHPRIVTVREPLLEVALEQVVPPGVTGQALIDAVHDPAVAHAVREAWHAELALRVDPEGKIVVDASPLNALRVDVLAAVFPGAPLLGVLRDPRDAVLDAYLADFDGSEWTAPLAELPSNAEVYALMARLWLRARDAYAASTDLRYEGILATPVRTLTAALARLGLDYHEACAEPPTGQDLSVVGAVSFGALRAPRKRSTVGRWVGYQTHLLPVLPELAEAVHAYGYAGTPPG